MSWQRFYKCSSSWKRSSESTHLKGLFQTIQETMHQALFILFPGVGQCIKTCCSFTLNQPCRYTLSLLLQLNWSQVQFYQHCRENLSLLLQETQHCVPFHQSFKEALSLLLQETQSQITFHQLCRKTPKPSLAMDPGMCPIPLAL